MQTWTSVSKEDGQEFEPNWLWNTWWYTAWMFHRNCMPSPNKNNRTVRYLQCIFGCPRTLNFFSPNHVQLRRETEIITTCVCFHKVWHIYITPNETPWGSAAGNSGLISCGVEAENVKIVIQQQQKKVEHVSIYMYSSFKKSSAVLTCMCSCREEAVKN